MKNKIIITISVLFLYVAAVSCNADEKDSVILNVPTTDVITTTVTQSESASTSAITASTAAATAIITTATTYPAEDDDIVDIVKEVCMRYHDNPGYTEERASEDAEFLIEIAKEFTEQEPMKVISEDDAKSRAKSFFIDHIGQWFIDEIESDYYEKNGVMLKLERNSPPYRCVYYDEYDVWAVTAVLRSGKLEDGSGLVHTGTSPYLFIRGKDGALLAAHC